MTSCCCPRRLLEAQLAYSTLSASSTLAGGLAAAATVAAAEKLRVKSQFIN